MIVLCTICSDLVNQSENIYVTKCGHMFHYDCLNAWIERSKSCPQCRNRVTEKCMFRVYPTTSNAPSGDEDAANLQTKLDATMLQIRQITNDLKAKDDKLTESNIVLKKNEELIKTYEKKILTNDSAIAALKEQLLYVKAENKEVKKLKEENETVKKNIQLLQGLQKVFNSTVGEVELMLEGYTDVRTIATFATALKKALYESEAKKTEIRNRLQAVRQELSMEKMNYAELKTKYLQSEDNLAAVTKNYEALKNKLKVQKDSDVSIIEDSWHSMLKPKIPYLDKSIDETIVINESNTSLNTLVKRIENADSPYLNLKQSNLALATLQRPSTSIIGKQKPSEYTAMLNTAKSTGKKMLQNVTNKNLNLSIFHKKEAKTVEFIEENGQEKSDMNMSYDGLGGHSKLETFPIARSNSWKPKSSVPKLTAKHKLKRPNPSGAQDIEQMFKKLKDK